MKAKTTEESSSLKLDELESDMKEKKSALDALRSKNFFNGKGGKNTCKRAKRRE